MNPAFREETDTLILEAKTSEDRLKLFVDVTRKSDKLPSAQELLALLGKHVPADAVNKGVLKSIVKALEENELVEGRRVSKGTPPVRGEDGKFLALVKEFSLQRENEPEQKGQGLRNRQVFENIEKGIIIGRVYPPKKGVDGVDVFGKPIPAEAGAEIKFDLDKRTLELIAPANADKSYMEVRSKCEGYLENKDGTVRIVEELVIAQDVDFHFGNVNFIGKVLVKGMVKPGFQVIAQKGIEILGNVIRGSVICPNADITVKGLVIGRSGDPARVVCGGTLNVRGASNTLFEVKGDMHVTKELRDCVVRCGQTVHATGATILGGKVIAVCGVDAKVLGSTVGVSTKIFLTSDVEMSADYKVIRHDLERHEKADALLRSHLGRLLENPKRVESLAEPHRSNMKKMLEKFLAIEKSKAKLIEKRDALLSTAKRSAGSRVNFHKKMYPGVRVYSSDLEYLCVEEVAGPKSVVFSPEENSLHIGAVGPLECQWVEDGG